MYNQSKIWESQPKIREFWSVFAANKRFTVTPMRFEQKIEIFENT
jgi:hypothetical protein